MPSSTTLPIMAGLSILGAALGINLGRAAIGEIDPAYFSEPASTFHADLSPNRSPDWAGVHRAEYLQAVSGETVADQCFGCRDYPVEYRPKHDPAVDGYQDGWAASAAHAEDSEVEIVEATAPDPEIERIQRYASYAVSAEPAEGAGEPEEAELAEVQTD